MDAEAPRGRVTLRHVAAAAGVSVATASRALTGRGELEQRTREHVIAVATALGYDRSTTPRGRPSHSESRTVELVLGTFDGEWTDEVVAGARRSAFQLGYDLVLTLEREDPADDWPKRVATRRPSGVILGVIRPTSRQLRELGALRIPLVLLDPRSDPDGEIASVGTTDFQGGYDAGAHLVATGVRRFAVLGGLPPFRFGRAREAGFRRAVADLAGDAAVHRIGVTWGGADVSPPIRRLTRDDRSPLGVFACTDDMALAVYRAARDLALSIPRDLGVVGFNDEPRAARAEPPLTTVRQPLGEMAGRAVELVHELQAGRVDRFERVELPTRLVVRASTGGVG